MAVSDDAVAIAASNLVFAHCTVAAGSGGRAPRRMQLETWLAGLYREYADVVRERPIHRGADSPG